MGKMFNSRILYIVPIIFLLVIAFRIIYSYYETKNQAYEFAQQQAEVLNSYAMVHRSYYQKLFINKSIPLNGGTLPALPAHSSLPISKTFSKNNTLKIHIQTVSDRARNPINAANDSELKAIRFFNNNPNKNLYFSDKNSEFYQYAHVLRIEEKCLKCHGSKESAPLFIQNRYNNAYDYKLGEIRGIMSITMPKNSLDNHFFKYFLYATIYDFFLFIALFISIYYLVKKSKQINEFLEFEVKSKTDELKNSLVIDKLTGLPNRLKLIEDLSTKEKNPNRHLALLNIDRFKDINDFYGHEAGDKILYDVSRTMTDISFNEMSDIYKLPSDEFALLTTSDISEYEFIKIISSIISKVQETEYKIEDNPIFITLSCGLASNRKYILTKADMALQVAKNDKKSLIIYDNSLNTSEQITKNLQGLNLLKDAIKNDNITPYFQPIYNVKTAQIEKYESLARIVLDNGEVIAPYKFLDIAIKSKLYPSITKNIIKKSFEFFKDKDYDFSINISINDVIDNNTSDFIIKSLQEFEKPERVVFEILESDKIGNYVELKEFITKIKEFSCKIAIDDFGSGYSNFSHILELDIDYLKIDASLVKQVTTDENAKKITKTIIRFASNLDIQTIAEFVEDKESLEILQEMGVDFIQGYYIGKPKPTLV